MTRLGRSSRRWFRRHGRFHVAVGLTIVVVAYLVVPWIASVVDASLGYRPSYYEPKDGSRQDFLVRHGRPDVAAAPWRVVVNVALVGLVVAVWLTVLPRRR